MVMYRCMYCGSPNVAVVTKNEGYSVKKGIVGNFLFGPVGSVMGINGKEKKCYRCSDCGMEASKPMASDTKNNIERYLSNPVRYKGMLEIEKKIYRNIEWEKPVVVSDNQSYNNYNHSSSIGEEKSFKNESELADAVWNYYLASKIPYMTIDTIKSGVLKNDSYSNMQLLPKAMNVLEKRGLVVRDSNNAYTFYDDAGSIKNNIKKYSEKVQVVANFNASTSDVLTSKTRLNAIQKFLLSNEKTIPTLANYTPYEKGGVLFTDSYMLFKLNCEYLPFGVSFYDNYPTKESYISKYNGKYAKVADGVYPNIIKFMSDMDKAVDKIIFNLPDIKERKKNKETMFTFETSSDYKVTLDLSKLLTLTKILGIKENEFVGYCSSSLSPVYILNKDNELGMILPIRLY